MTVFHYWLPAVLLAASVVLLVVNLKLRHEVNALLVEESAMLLAVETHIQVLGERNKDFAEAMELLRYGAHDEAIELLKNWGTVHRVTVR